MNPVFPAGPGPDKQEYMHLCHMCFPGRAQRTDPPEGIGIVGNYLVVWPTPQY
jgi:hypothetical protein